MYCPICGEELKLEYKECPKCKSPLDWSDFEDTPLEADTVSAGVSAALANESSKLNQEQNSNLENSDYSAPNANELEEETVEKDVESAENKKSHDKTAVYGASANAAAWTVNSDQLSQNSQTYKPNTNATSYYKELDQDSAFKRDAGFEDVKYSAGSAASSGSTYNSDYEPYNQKQSKESEFDYLLRNEDEENEQKKRIIFLILSAIAIIALLIIIFTILGRRNARHNTIDDTFNSPEFLTDASSSDSYLMNSETTPNNTDIEKSSLSSSNVTEYISATPTPEPVESTTTEATTTTTTTEVPTTTTTETTSTTLAPTTSTEAPSTSTKATSTTEASTSTVAPSTTTEALTTTTTTLSTTTSISESSQTETISTESTLPTDQATYEELNFGTLPTEVRLEPESSETSAEPNTSESTTSEETDPSAPTPSPTPVPSPTPKPIANDSDEANKIDTYLNLDAENLVVAKYENGQIQHKTLELPNFTDVNQVPDTIWIENYFSNYLLDTTGEVNPYKTPEVNLKDFEAYLQRTVNPKISLDPTVEYYFAPYEYILEDGIGKFIIPKDSEEPTEFVETEEESITTHLPFEIVQLQDGSYEVKSIILNFDLREHEGYKFRTITDSRHSKLLGLAINSKVIVPFNFDELKNDGDMLFFLNKEDLVHNIDYVKYKLKPQGNGFILESKVTYAPNNPDIEKLTELDAIQNSIFSNLNVDSIEFANQDLQVFDNPKFTPVEEIKPEESSTTETGDSGSTNTSESDSIEIKPITANVVATIAADTEYLQFEIGDDYHYIALLDSGDVSKLGYISRAEADAEFGEETETA